MTIIIYSKDLPMSEIINQVREIIVNNSGFPIEIKIGPGTFKIQDAEQAKFFSLGIFAYMSAIEEKEQWNK